MTLRKNKTYFRKGGYNVICDRCGFEFKSFQVRKTWDGLIVCKEDWEPRHPQDLIRVPSETSQTVPDPRPEPAPTYITLPNIYVEEVYWIDPNISGPYVA